MCTVSPINQLVRPSASPIYRERQFMINLFFRSIGMSPEFDRTIQPNIYCKTQYILPVFPDVPHLRGGKPAGLLALFQDNLVASVSGRLDRPRRPGLGERRYGLENGQRLPDNALDCAGV